MGGEAQEGSRASEASARRGERGLRAEQQAGGKPFVVDASVPVSYIVAKQCITQGAFEKRKVRGGEAGKIDGVN